MIKQASDEDEEVISDYIYAHHAALQHPHHDHTYIDNHKSRP